MNRDRCSQTLANNCAAGIEDALCAALVFAETFSRNVRKVSGIRARTTATPQSLAVVARAGEDC